MEWGGRGGVEMWCELESGEEVGALQISCVSERSQLLYGWVVQLCAYSSKMHPY